MLFMGNLYVVAMETRTMGLFKTLGYDMQKYTKEHFILLIGRYMTGLASEYKWLPWH